MQSEADRRQNLVDDLLTREKQLQVTFKNDGTEPEFSRSSLMTGGGGQRGSSNPWLMDEPEETRGLGFTEIKQQQQRIIEAQDAGLDALASVLSRQKQMGQEIGNELDEHNACRLVIVNYKYIFYSTSTGSVCIFLVGHGKDVMSSFEIWDSAFGKTIGTVTPGVGGAIHTALACSLQGPYEEIIDDLAHLVDKTDNRIRNETRRVKLVEKKSASCGMVSFNRICSLCLKCVCVCVCVDIDIHIHKCCLEIKGM
ncbi:Syntaxin-8 [Acipenser ruthenus]|uniref:Syntaxin-8 n=1 Tax=Acipenser ruthenus TaxID=7906 RepID=A0A444UGC3_ACIRT|nr:Syntaxin-8 [Acipenser ruthenus]